MEILIEVSCRVMKGMGAAWTDKTVTVFLDDVDNSATETEVRELVLWDVKAQLERAGFIRYTIKDINSA
jgi:hypothetical protein